MSSPKSIHDIKMSSSCFFTLKSLSSDYLDFQNNELDKVEFASFDKSQSIQAEKIDHTYDQICGQASLLYDASDHVQMYGKSCLIMTMNRLIHLVLLAPTQFHPGLVAHQCNTAIICCSALQ